MTEPDPRTVTRSKTMQVSPAGPGQFRFSARLTDSAAGGDFSGDTATIHDFALDGEVEGPDLTLVSLQVRAYSHPYAECPFVIPATRALLGKSLMTAWRRSVLDELGGSRGCTHVTTMLLGLGELATMVFFLRINEQVPYTPAARTDGRWIREALTVAPSLGGDVCFGLRRDGAAMSALEPAEPEGEPDSTLL
jgi:DUF2889 family protein